MDGDDGSETTVEASVRVTATEVVSYSVYSAPLPPPPPYEPPSVNYYYRYNGQQISGVHVPYEATNSNMVIITQPASPQQIPVKQSFGCHYFWSCITFWFCGLFFGGIAFILAATGNTRASQGDVQGARRLGLASVTFIIVGLIVGCIAWGLILWWLVVDVANCPWSVYGVCYNFRNCYYTSTDCRRYFSDYYYLNGCCYYNY